MLEELVDAALRVVFLGLIAVGRKADTKECGQFIIEVG